MHAGSMADHSTRKDQRLQNYVQSLIQSGLPLSFLSWAYIRQSVYFILGRMLRRGYRFSAFSYAKPSDIRHNFRPTRNDEDV